jgi:hypothetical protein
VPLVAGKTVKAVTLPSVGDVVGYNPGAAHFAVSIG